MQLEEEIDTIFSHNSSSIFTKDTKRQLVDLETRKANILRIQEENWRIKNRAISINQSDRNTKFFHKYASQRSNHNAIWDLKDNEGKIISSHKDLEKVVVDHFSYIFRDPKRTNILAQLKVIQHYPMFFF